ncbi:uracil-DNA glycosylase [Candidatus Pelagibacter sp.]|uniref:uracil-DNA glycosylase n=1 Tax=Candidatus Pelagibacter sp. TaxID=2024849 RepID=UPI003F8289B3
MIKNKSEHSSVYTDELINTIEQDFIFSNKPINRFKNNTEIDTNKNLQKNELLEELKNQINSIENCNLKSNSKNIVLGDGNSNSPIMLIGEAPTTIEDDNCKVFQGEVGVLLDKMLNAINIKRNSIYLCYAINFRPPEDRKPTSQEIKRYSIFLKKHISIIDPKLIIVMGSSAMEALTGTGNKISKERGNWKEIILDNKTYPMMISFNPSYLIRFPENKKYSWEDLKKIRDKIQELKIKL